MLTAGLCSYRCILKMANDVIIDEILCFVSNAIDTLPGDDLIASCVSAFDVSDIRRSKLQFFTYCKRLSGDADIPNGGIKHIARRGDSPVNLTILRT